MTTQMTLNQFNTLTLNEKFEMFGEEIFTAKQFNLLEYLIEEIEAQSEVISIDLGVSKRSLGSTVGALSWCEMITINETIYGDKIYLLDTETLEDVFFNLEDLIEEKLLELVEEVQAEEVQAEEVQAEEDDSVQICYVETVQTIINDSTLNARQLNAKGHRGLDGSRLNKHVIDAIYNAFFGTDAQPTCTCGKCCTLEHTQQSDVNEELEAKVTEIVTACYTEQDIDDNVINIKDAVEFVLNDLERKESMKDQIIKDLKEKSMSIKTLAADMNCSYEHLTRILNGKLPMSYKVAKRLCESLNKLTSNNYHLTDFGF